MRIGFFTVRMLLGYGVDLVVHELARRLATEHGHDVTVWTPTTDGTYGAEPYAIEKLLVYGAEWNRILPLHELNAHKALRKLATELSDAGQPLDAVVPCTHPYYGAGGIFGCPELFFNFGNVPTTGFSWKGKLNWKWLDYAENVLHKPRASRVVSISRFLSEQQGMDIQRRGEVVNLGADHYQADNQAELRASMRERLGIGTDEIVLGYCGRLNREHPPYKGTSEVLALGRRIAEVQKNTRLVLCGLGSEADAEWIRGEGAIPLTNLPPEEMAAFYSALDIYICASRWEGWNLPIVEAGWFGVPSVAYDAGAHKEHVTSVLVPGGSYDELCSAALTLVRNTKLRQRLAADTHVKARRYTWNACAAEFNRILREATQC